MPLVWFFQFSSCSYTNMHVIRFRLLSNLIAFYGWKLGFQLNNCVCVCERVCACAYRKKPFASIYSHNALHKPTVYVVFGIYAHISYVSNKTIPSSSPSFPAFATILSSLLLAQLAQSMEYRTNFYWQFTGMGYRISKIHFVQRLFNHNPVIVLALMADQQHYRP